VKIEDIKVGDWVDVYLNENLPPYIGQVKSLWPPYAKVEVRIGGARQEAACKIEDLNLVK
jgi:predicted Mrr-cat superfamily restriction endonuclease